MILVTGGAGYIGSHTVLQLLRAGEQLMVLDNFCNSSSEALRRVGEIAGMPVKLVEGDVRNTRLLMQLFSQNSFSGVLHFAGLKSVGDSVANPLDYYSNNVCGSQNLLKIMSAAGVFKFIFSSSATVYGKQDKMPISEACEVGKLANPYGRSKLFVEEILRDLASADQRWQIAILRYFNPVGADESGLIGEDPRGIPNNLVPYLTKVAVGKLPELVVFGDDYPTHDGTGIRDYIHVVDLAEGHLAALRAIEGCGGVKVWNLGTGKGYSVLDVVHAFEIASGCKIPYRIASRRRGDLASCYSDPVKANYELSWKATRTLPEMMRDAWNWQRLNPNGYK